MNSIGLANSDDVNVIAVSLYFSPVDAMIAQDFCPQRVPATESIAVAMVEGQIVRTDNLHGDSRPQGCAQSLPPCFRRGRLCRL